MRKNIKRIGPSTSQSHTPRGAISARSNSSQAPDTQLTNNVTDSFDQKDNHLALPSIKKKKSKTGRSNSFQVLPKDLFTPAPAIETEDVDEGEHTPETCESSRKADDHFTFKVMKEYKYDGELMRAKKRAEEEEALKAALEKEYIASILESHLATTQQAFTAGQKARFAA